ncbi:hypothetical protein GY45DRAFT_464412 [Cubamyces sp. BRFM 1775]|nr:hypothetical protein GY45DRAFT_464412 [Cubamyces sp. BRFM 1775]
MHLSPATRSAIALVITLPALPGFAASCYHANKCDYCESVFNIESACEWFCGNGFWQQSASFPWGYGHITLDGSFNTEADCSTACNDIIEECYSYQDGGINTYSDSEHNARLNLNFCNCE